MHTHTHTYIHTPRFVLSGQHQSMSTYIHPYYIHTYTIFTHHSHTHMHIRIQVEPLGPNEAEIGMFSVDPDQQSQGIGRKLLDQAESFAREKLGAKTTVMHVIDIREDLLTWYARMGYEKTGVKVPFPVGANCGEPKMELQFERIEKKI